MALELCAEEMCEGMRVYLTNPDPGYEIGPPNPATDSPYECVGTVNIAHLDDDNEQDDYIEVTWENGEVNTYKNYELSECREAGNRESFWTRI